MEHLYKGFMSPIFNFYQMSVNTYGAKLTEFNYKPMSTGLGLLVELDLGESTSSNCLVARLYRYFRAFKGG